jgi:hypothetical protein
VAPSVLGTSFAIRSFWLDPLDFRENFIGSKHPVQSAGELGVSRGIGGSSRLPPLAMPGNSEKPRLPNGGSCRGDKRNFTDLYFPEVSREKYCREHHGQCDRSRARWVHNCALVRRLMHKCLSSLRCLKSRGDKTLAALRHSLRVSPTPRSSPCDRD